MQKTRSGDTQAFAALVERYRDSVYGVALYVVGEPECAAEVAQDAFFLAYRRLRQLRDPSRFSAWLRKIAMNLARDRLAARRSRRDLTSLDAVGEIEDPGLSPSEVAERVEIARLIRLLMAKLSDAQRLTFTLFYINGYTEQDLSEILEVPTGTIKSRLNRARSRLREEAVEMAEEVLKDSTPDADFWRSATGCAEGRVTNATTGDPVVGATIRLSENVIGVFASVRSDEGGRWRAERLVPGSYFIAVSHPEFVEQRDEHGHMIPCPCPRLVVRPGQTLRGIDFQLQPGATVAGVVLDADGSPVPNARVYAWLRRAERHRLLGCLQRKGFAGAGVDGTFRLSSLPGGSFLLGANAGEFDDYACPRPMSYYPNTLSPDDAEWVEVSPGKPMLDLALRLVETGPVQLCVHVIDSESGRPIASATVLIIRRDLGVADRFSGQTDQHGNFRSDLVTHGTYHITAGHAEEGYPRWSRWVDIASEQQTTEVELRLPKGAYFEGTIATKDGSELPDLEGFIINLAPAVPEGVDQRSDGWVGFGGPGIAHRGLSVREGPQSERARVCGGGRISWPPVAPGKVEIRTQVRDREWRIASMVIDGKPMSIKEAIICEPGQRIGNLEVVIESNLGVVVGRVVPAEGRPRVTDVWGMWAKFRWDTPKWLIHKGIR